MCTLINTQCNQHNLNKDNNDIIYVVSRRNVHNDSCQMQGNGSLWSSLGGVLSLCLGISFASLFEFVEIAIDLVSNFVNYITGRNIGRAHQKL